MTGKRKGHVTPEENPRPGKAWAYPENSASEAADFEGATPPRRGRTLLNLGRNG